MLYLFPNLLADLGDHAAYLPSSVDAAAAQIVGLIAENEKEGRRFLKRVLPKTFRDIPIVLLNEHTTLEQKEELAQKIATADWGLVSDCGMPCLADPGADLVLLARQRGIAVKTFAGPSSILFALVLSGLGGQHFTFHGYLPKEEKELIKELKRIEKMEGTHLFIETPYRNNRLMEKMVQCLEGQTWLSVACDLTMPTEWVQTRKVKDWKAGPMPDLDKRPTVFSLRTKSPEHLNRGPCK